MDMYKKQWFECYNYCTSEQYSFLYFNSQQPLGSRVMKRFDQFVKFKTKGAVVMPDSSMDPESDNINSPQKKKQKVSDKCTHWKYTLQLVNTTP